MTIVASTTGRAAIYCRVSTLDQSERGYSLEAQARDCRKHAADLGLAVGELYQDTESGASWDLPGLNGMLDAAKRGEFDAVVVYTQDRLARNMAKQLVIDDELRRAGVTMHYVTLRLEDSAEGRLMKHVSASIAEYEREKITLRTSRGRREKAEQGLVVGLGIAPYGLRYTRQTDRRGRVRVVGMEPDPDEAPIVQRIFRDAQTFAISDIAKQLNALGVPTRRGGAAGWQTSTIGDMLRNTTYLGHPTYGKRDRKAKRWRAPSEVFSASIPALVEQSTWDTVHATMTRRRARYTRPRINAATDQYSLRSLLTCGHCGGALSCVPSHGHRYYKCIRAYAHTARRLGTPQCDFPPIFAPAIEDDVWERLEAVLLDPEALNQGLAAQRAKHLESNLIWQKRRETLEVEIAKLQKRLNKITIERLDAEDGSAAVRALQAAATETERTIDRFTAELGNLQPSKAEGLSADEALRIREFVGQLRELHAGFIRLTPQDRARIFAAINLSGTVRLDSEHGRAYSDRTKHAHAVDWQAWLELSETGRNTGRDTKKLRLMLFTSDYACWDAAAAG